MVLVSHIMAVFKPVSAWRESASHSWVPARRAHLQQRECCAPIFSGTSFRSL